MNTLKEQLEEQFGIKVVGIKIHKGDTPSVKAFKEYRENTSYTNPIWENVFKTPINLKDNHES